ncbi:MAG TPA: class I tRNA ligase family protein [Phycisphaerales bacterium]|nr:class I tRNA ligase family protein [Phycisphaerales bacterium]
MSETNASRPAPLPTRYLPAEHEDRVRTRWDEAAAFHADPQRVLDGHAAPFCILIPPPNVTAALHLGHALNNSLQDILCRAHRMMGFETLWMPGTDHAGIATQTVVEKRVLAEDGKRRTDFTREEFVAKIQAFKDEYEATITDQLKRIGCSCDWQRQRFTMDEVCARAVREAFFRLFRDGLIYRGKRLVNWDPATQTALADDEVEMEEVDGHFYYLRYPLVHSPRNPADPHDAQEVTWSELAARGYPGADAHDPDDNAWLTVATTRPETYLGDTAVAVNPKDPRAVPLRGLFVQLPLVGRVIPIVEDDYVVMPDAESDDAKARYATGFLKVTPAHDPNDYEIGRRHDLPVINVMAPDASISDKHGWTDVGDAAVFLGKSREDARELVVREFHARGLLERTTPYRHSVGHSYRSHVPIEPYLSDQWYVKVTDDRLRGAALRAMAPEQRTTNEPRPNEPRPLGSGSPRPRTPATPADPTSRDPTSRDRQGAVPLKHYFITFTTYGTWLHGDERGSVDRNHNTPNTPPVEPNEVRSGFEKRSLKHDPVELTARHRPIVARAIAEVCEHRGWTLLACNVRTNHVHTVVIANQTPERVMNDFKSYATRALRATDASIGEGIWTRHGSTRYLNTENSLTGALRYVLDEQGEDLGGVIRGKRRQPPRRNTEARDEPLPYGRGSLIREGRSSSDSTLRFHPDRYARTFEHWHENLRDWCISRQLWWGHRIPAWRGEGFSGVLSDYLTLDQRLSRWVRDGRIAVHRQELGTPEEMDEALRAEEQLRGQWNPSQIDQVRASEPYVDAFVCVRASDDVEVIQALERAGFRQDPDVLDTWFSSALWPLSTMGWPDADAAARATGAADFPALLSAFNPTDVLCTGRDIITLWVSRMVMFNRYFLDEGAGTGRLPFRDVYIHPIIQDGHGQRMSKSLGNGVNPLDIVHSHGADALRLVLCQAATATQDVRMPVDLVCPHCAHTFEPAWATTPAGHRVAAPHQACPACSKKMVTSYGVASGHAKPTADAPVAMNSSTRFDAGRNFCNKLWNASRFALSILEKPGEHDTGEPVARASLPLVDRWMLSRLESAVLACEQAVAGYQFAAYAQAAYDLLWRDFCDWYLEAIKPTVAASRAQRSVLAHVFEATLRLLHPIIPFVTEAIFERARAVVADPLDGVTLAPSRKGGLLATAGWPILDDDLRDEAAEREFERIRALITAIRDVRSQHQTPPKRRIRLHAPTEIVRLAAAAEPIVQTLASLHTVTADTPDGPSVSFRFEGHELRLGDLADAVDAGAERERLSKRITDLDRSISALETRLANPGYADRAPAHLVQQTRDQLDRARAERDAAAGALESLP